LTPGEVDLYPGQRVGRSAVPRSPACQNTSPEGKASAVQFIRFRFTPQQIAAFKQPGAQITLGFDHPNYGHMAMLPEPVRAALAEDFA